jgi:hypothetical protein
MARAFQFDVGPVVEQLNRILQMELAAIIYYTHYSFMIYGHARICRRAGIWQNCRCSSPAPARRTGDRTRCQSAKEGYPNPAPHPDP